MKSVSPKPALAGVVTACLLLAGCGGEEQGAATEPLADEVVSSTAPADSAGEGEQVTRLTLAGVSLDLPPGWERRDPSSTMRSAEFVVPNPEGEPAVFAVFVGLGGGVEANLDRWEQQIEAQEDWPYAVRTTVQRDGLTVASIARRGTFAPGMPGGPASPRPDWVLLGTIVQGTEDGPVFIKGTGPADLLEPAITDWLAMVESIQPASVATSP